MLTSSIQGCLEQAKKKNMEIALECSPRQSLNCNKQLIEQALLNLLVNAIKYSPEKTPITIRAVFENEKVLLEVEDKGLGIAKEHIPRLFERFYRVDKARSRDQGGTGLGLAIVKHIALAHKGSVEVSSKPGKGSLFRITLPRHV
jgi:two-component system phosphate regulon sensor histidine kinase PhoR